LKALAPIVFTYRDLHGLCVSVVAFAVSLHVSRFLKPRLVLSHDHDHDDSGSHGGNDSHGHSDHVHGLTASGEVAGVSDTRLLWCVAINQLLTVGQAIAGVVSGSVALLSDAAHNFNDANALLIAYFARRFSRRSANARYTFGFRRAELIGATINLTLLGVIGLYLLYEGILRFFDPQPIIGWLMAAAAVLALVIDVATALLLWSMSKGSLNVRAAFVHNMVDALGSLAVLLGAAAIIWLDWWWIDPLLTVLISLYILWQVITMLPQATRILMEGTPVGLDLDDLAAELESVSGVDGVHHLHVWELDEQHRAFEAHVVIDASVASELETIKKAVKDRLATKFEIQHSTLEFEFGGEELDCGDNDCL
jgi:cobalt-zinc-cadmium efflux system protein